MQTRVLMVLGGLAALPLTACNLWDDLWGSDHAPLGGASPAPSSTAPARSGIAPQLAPLDGNATSLQCELTPSERQTLVDLALRPQPCSDSATCPKGSFCDAEHNNVCNWQCLSDSDCGTGSCSCSGSCSNAAPGSGTDNGDPSCPIDASALDELKAAPRSCDENSDCPYQTQCDTATGKCSPRGCEWDDNCPYGSFCDRSLGRCTWECRRDDEEHACSSGSSCDCTGRCVGGDASPERPKQRLPELRVSSAVIRVLGTPTSTAWQRAFDVTLTTTDEELLTTSAGVLRFDAAVSVVPGRGLRVACAPASSSMTFTDGCDLDGDDDTHGHHWRFTKQGDAWTAQQTVFVKASTQAQSLDTELDPKAWSLRLHSNLTNPDVREVSVAFDTGTTSSDFEENPVFTTRQLYKGSLVFTAPGSRSGAPTADIGLGARIPIQAAVLPHCDQSSGNTPCLVIQDPLHGLSTGSVIRLWLGGSATNYAWLDGNAVSGGSAILGGTDYSLMRLPTTTQGTGPAAHLVSSVRREKKTGNLVGSLSISGFHTFTDAPALPGQINATVTLLPNEVETCETDADCDAGETCILGTFCGSENQQGLGIIPPLANTEAQPWLNGMRSAVESTLGNNYDITDFRFLYDNTTGLGGTNPGAYADAFEGPIGQQFFADFFTEGDPLATCWTTTRAMFNAMSVSGSFVNGPQLRGCDDAAYLHPGYAPCVGFSAYSGSPLGFQFGADCDAVYNNIRAKHPEMPASYEQACVESNVITFAFGMLPSVWYCPNWVDVGLRPNPREAEFNLCPDGPNSSNGIPFGGSLGRGNPPQQYSGDPFCQTYFSDYSLLGQAGPDLMFQADRGRGTSLGAADLLRACLSDFARPQPASNGAPLSSFAGSTCFSQPEFFGAIGALDASIVAGTAGPADFRLYLRLLQQWVEIHTFMANQARQELELAEVDNGAASLPDPVTPPPLDMQALLARLAGGAAFVVNHTFTEPFEPASLFDETPAPDALKAALRKPGYPERVVGEHVEWEQRFGAAPAILEFATAYAKVLELVARDAGLRHYSEQLGGAKPAEIKRVLTQFGDGLRFVFALEAYSTDLYRRAFDSLPACVSASNCADFDGGSCVAGQCTTSLWSKRWTKSLDALNAARNTALATASALAAGDNPIGVSENDVPLFFGDLTGANSRFFASSDYLMSNWATSAVSSARDALDQARSAWVDQRNSKIQDALLASDRDRRLDTIKSDAGRAIAAACGLDDSVTDDQVLALVQSGELDLNHCYVVPASKNDKCVPKSNDGSGGSGGSGGTSGSGGSSGTSACLDGKYRKLQDANLEVLGFFDDACHAWFKEHPYPREATLPSAAAVVAEVPIWQKAHYDVCVTPGSSSCVGSFSNRRSGDQKVGFIPASFQPTTNFNGVIGATQLDQIRSAQAGLNFESCSAPGNGRLWDPDAKRLIDCQPTAGYDPRIKVTVFAGAYGSSTADFFPYAGMYFKTGDSGGEALLPAVKHWRCYASQDFADRNNALRNVPVADGDIQAATDECTQLNDVAGSIDRQVSRPGLPLECYRGGLGSAALRVLKAQQEADMVDLMWAEKQLEYSIQARACAQMQDDAALLDARTTAFNADMKVLARTREDLAISMAFFSTLSDLVSNPSNIILGGPKFGASLGDQLVSAEMADATVAHQKFLQDFAQDQNIKACFVEADKMRATFTSARERIVIQATEAADAAIEFIDLLNEAKRVSGNGTAQLEREAGRRYGGYTFHYWYDEKVSRYLREFTWAKRLVFLAMRAVEYEFQQSLDLREQILTAKHPDQLEAALRGLQQEVATRAINRRRPEESSVVVSLRDDVLGTPDQSDAPAGERAYSSSLIFRKRIWDQRYAVRGRSGEYLGQGVRFTLAPQGVLENRCAERLWRVTATVQGDGLSDSEPGAPVVLLKSNTFSSQWCDGHERAAQLLQSGTIQPSRNLFKDPGSNVDGSDQSLFSTASIYPWFNIRRSDFFKTAYQEGASEELAGRGLYGDYILLFPRALLEGNASPVALPKGSTGDGVEEKFPLGNVEDVLLRFDFLSIDNFPSVDH